jgi:hypothetical protein
VHAPEQVHNHDLASVALNYPCLISQLRVIRHNKTKYRENGTREEGYFYLCCPLRLQHTFRSWMETRPQGDPGARYRRLRQWWWALPDYLHRLQRGLPSTSTIIVVGTPGLPALPPKRPTINVYDNGGGRSRTTGITSQGAHQ